MQNKKIWFDLEAGYYDQIIKYGLIKNRGIQANWHNLTYKNVLEEIGERSILLDYASGSGTFIGRYYNEKDSIGVDISKDQIDYSKNEFPQHIFLNDKDFYTDDYLNYFDVITILGLIEFLNIEEVDNLLAELKKCLKPGGKLIITTPNYSLLMRLYLALLSRLKPNNYEPYTVNKLNSKVANLISKSWDFQSYEIKKIVSFGVFFSFISIDFGIMIDKFIQKIFKNSLGYILLITLKK